MAILVAYDGSYPARKAVRYALDTHGDDPIILLRVIEAAGGSTGAGWHLAKKKLEELFSEVEAEVEVDVDDLFDTDDVDVQIELVAGNPAREIVEYAEEHDIDHIIVGNHGRDGVSRILLGSVAEKVVRRAAVPVTVVR